MTIRKAIIQVTVLYDPAIGNSPEGMSLAEIGYQIDEGDMIGQSAIASDVDVPADTLDAELLAIGNDGTFFSHDGED